jgi:hypothetical protein
VRVGGYNIMRKNEGENFPGACSVLVLVGSWRWAGFGLGGGEWHGMAICFRVVEALGYWYGDVDDGCRGWLSFPLPHHFDTSLTLAMTASSLGHLDEVKARVCHRMLSSSRKVSVFKTVQCPRVRS